MLPLFALTIFLGAALLFIAEPMAAKLVLPLLGGSPAVWNTCMVFFQATLLAGYLGAHLIAKLRTSRQATLYLVLLAIPLVASSILHRLIVAAPQGVPPSTAESPIPWLLATLAAMIGAPFLVISAAAPLLQRWFADSGHKSAKDPYFLYAASNAGSLIGLLGYPTLIEPWLTLTGQRRAWSMAFGLFAILTACCAFVALTTAPAPAPAAQDAPEPAPAPTWRTRLFWLFLAAVPSSLVLGVTQHLSTDIAAVPLLWVIPLATYLLTFILAFSGRDIPIVSLSKILPILVIGLAIVALVDARTPVVVIILLHLLALFACALLCHARLAQNRPHPSRLTEFYLWIATGGVLGGMFNALAAPVLFNSVIEYPLALVLALMVRVPRRDYQPNWTPGTVALTIAAPITVASLIVCAEGLIWHAHITNYYVQRAIGTALPAIIAYACTRVPLSFALAAGAMFGAAVHLANVHEGNLRQVRTFFGLYRVSHIGRFTQLVHGTTAHGLQFRDPEQARIPLGYYHPEGPIGDVFTEMNALPLFDRIGLVGLGSGALAAYGRPGQEITFHEIDPAIVQIARDPQCFTYLRDSKANPNIRINLGDGRLTMARIPDGYYGLILLDAFSSDAIPVHLITREAVRLYLSKLRPHGIIAFHISNHFLNLEPILRLIGDDLGLSMILCLDEPSDAATRTKGIYGSQWMLLARDAADLKPVRKFARWQDPAPAPDAPLWTDDYSNILGVFYWK